ncbi:hypothetical protein BDW59DRAFT_179815 [Aspergillus cavernicola]|uniref:Peptidase M43 pregnancy-associated plasma-A domain-containing protein n=1 Tax=Aspergillus cavernicola TaxID=176166 RepID=A0ABR4IFZ8_9EURO
MRFLPIFLGLSALVSARCGTQPPSENLKAHHKYFQDKEDRDASSRLATRDVFNVTIDTYVHVILTNTTHVNRTALPAQIHSQIEVLNENYEGTGFSFNLLNITYTPNNNWQQINQESQTEWEVKSTLRRGDYTTLNIYYGGLGNDLLGYATFPDNVSPRDFLLDGVVNSITTLPGGAPPFDLGITAVHEIGHWLNLLHTFQPSGNDPDLPGCFGPGDYIHDTPAEAVASYGCPRLRDTCAGTNETTNQWSLPGVDPIHNFMDYSDDDCLSNFTPGQVIRMQNSWVEGRVAYVPGVAGRRARRGSGW